MGLRPASSKQKGRRVLGTELEESWASMRVSSRVNAHRTLVQLARLLQNVSGRRRLRYAPEGCGFLTSKKEYGPRAG